MDKSVNFIEKSFLGNDKLKQTLSGIISDGRLFHAVLFEGETGCGKKTLARLFAAGVLCRSHGMRPCGECSVCRKVLNSSHPDVEIYGGEGSRSFHIDTVREIKSGSYILPNESDKKVIILSDVQDMTVQAQNALLKIFEEPPEHVIFILTCDNINKLLPTIVSRAAIYRVEPLSHSLCVSELIKRTDAVSREEADMYARLFNGNLGECIKACSNEEYKNLIWDCVSFVKYSGIDEYKTLSLTARFGEKQQLISALRLLKLLFYLGLRFICKIFRYRRI